MGRPKKFNRTEVLEKAMPLFWERGFADTGLQDLEKVTGVNKSGLYAEFANKEDLFLEALRHYGKNRRSLAILAQEPAGWENIEALLKLPPLRSDGQKGCFSVNTMREVGRLPEAAKEIISDNRQELKALMRKNLAAAKPNGSIDVLVEILATFFSGICIEQNLCAPPDETLKKIDAFMQMLRSM